MSHAAFSSLRRFNPGFVWWVLIAGTVVAVVMVTVSLQVMRGFAETQALRSEVTRSYEVRAELRHVLSLHQDLETGQRGYVLTGDARFLEPYSGADDTLTAAFARLGSHELAGGNAVRGELDDLRRISALKRRFAEEVIALTGAGQTARARARIAGGEGKRLMDGIRAIIESIDHQERAELAERTRIAENARQRLQHRIVYLLFVLIGLLVLALAFVMRAYRGWERTLQREREIVARHEATFQAARDGMLVINASGSIESINPAAGTMFGYLPDELVRRDVGVLFEVAPDRGQVETFLKRLAARTARAPREMQEFIGRAKDGSLLPVEVSVSPVVQDGRVRFLVVVRDVTERRQIDRMKTEFVSTVSHELRTPLTSISGSLGLIVGGAAGPLPDRAQRLVEIAQSNCARLIRLINDILDVEKIESGRMTFVVRPLELRRLLPQAIEAIRPFAATHEVELHLEDVPSEAIVMGDEDRVMQVVTNLLSNAAKFSPQGETVSVRVVSLDRRYRISVADRGPGVPESFRQRIFDKFAQADSSDTRQKGGTGLGLSIVREIVERLGGCVSFDSTPGAGATFHVDLPAAARTAHADETAEALGRISAGALPQILHVDDDPDMLRLVYSAFDDQAQVHSSPSVIEARAAIRRYQFDVIVLDLAMADGDGLDLLPLIRQRQSAPVVVFTAQDADPERLAGVDLVLVKSRDSLTRLVDEVIRLTTRNQESKTS